MKKEFGVILILSLLVLSLSFTSASWFSDVWDKITGNTITGEVTFNGNVVSHNGATLVPLYRWYNHVDGRHVYSISVSEDKKNTFQNPKNWTYEGIEAYVHSSQIQGAVPLFRLDKYGSNPDHLYTTSVQENATVIANDPTWHYWGIAAYVYNNSVPGSVPLYRSFHPSGGHFFTVSSSDNLNLNLSQNWRSEGIAGYVFANCSRICGTGSRFLNNNRLNTPGFPSFPISAVVGTPVQIDVTSTTSGNYGYEFWWVYRFSNGDVEEFCSCDFYNNTIWSNGLSKGDLKLFSGPLNNPSYSLNLNITNEMGRRLSSISFRAASRNTTTRSNWSNWNTITIGNPSCPNTPCDELGENISVSGKNDKYKTCVYVNGCLNWSAEQTCPVGNLFNNNNGRCISSGSNTCRGNNPDTGKPKICFENTSVGAPFGSSIQIGSCGNNYQICIACDVGTSWDASQKECITDGCLNNCTGICSGVSVGNAFNNTNMTCCSSKSCYVCDVGYHIFNGSCVLDDCVGDKPLENSPNVSFGVNKTNSSSVNMTWNYVRGVAGACQWNCSVDYKINVLDNRSCVYGRVNCSELNGICSATALSNAKVDNEADCVSGSCYVCNEDQRYFSDGNACVFNNSCASGYVWNGFICSPYVQCASNCTINGRCIVSEPNRIVRTSINVSGKIVKAYCDPSSKVFAELLADNQTCSYNAQCASNLCGADMRCLNIAKEVRDASGLFKKVYCWFSNGFSYTSAQYNACLAAQ